MATRFDELHVGKLFVAGQAVEGGAAHPAPLSTVVPALADSEATSIKALVADHNALLAALRAAGVLAKE